MQGPSPAPLVRCDGQKITSSNQENKETKMVKISTGSCDGDKYNRCGELVDLSCMALNYFVHLLVTRP